MNSPLHFRSATPADEAFLREMLYEAIHPAPGQPRPARAIVQTPALARYVDGWGRAGDVGLVALAVDVPVGAVWLRLWTGAERGYGFVDPETPELSMALRPEARGQGIGTQLLDRLFCLTSGRYPRISLSVSPGNPALRLYRRAGFETVGDDGHSLLLLRTAATPPPCG